VYPCPFLADFGSGAYCITSFLYFADTPKISRLVVISVTQRGAAQRRALSLLPAAACGSRSLPAGTRRRAGRARADVCGAVGARGGPPFCAAGGGSATLAFQERNPCISGGTGTLHFPRRRRRERSPHSSTTRRKMSRSRLPSPQTNPAYLFRAPPLDPLDMPYPRALMPQPPR
jgi:hypothetical protein